MIMPRVSNVLNNSYWGHEVHITYRDGVAYISVMLPTSFFLLDLLTVSETAHDVTFDEGNGINSPTNLGLEATFINQNFSQQCLKRGPDKKVFANPNPFITDEDEGQVASVAYRYLAYTFPFVIIGRMPP